MFARAGAEDKAPEDAGTGLVSSFNKTDDEEQEAAEKSRGRRWIVRIPFWSTCDCAHHRIELTRKSALEVITNYL